MRDGIKNATCGRFVCRCIISKIAIKINHNLVLDGIMHINIDTYKFDTRFFEESYISATYIDILKAVLIAYILQKSGKTTGIHNSAHLNKHQSF